MFNKTMHDKIMPDKVMPDKSMNEKTVHNLCKVLGVKLEEEFYFKLPTQTYIQKYKISEGLRFQFYNNNWHLCDSEDELTYMINHSDKIIKDDLFAIDKTECMKFLDVLNAIVTLIPKADEIQIKDIDADTFDMGKVTIWSNKDSFGNEVSRYYVTSLDREIFPSGIKSGIYNISNTIQALEWKLEEINVKD